MIIATFGPGTGWAGKTITYDAGVFAFEGHGVLSAGDVMEYDRQGYLLWATDGTRAWIASLTQPAQAQQAQAPQSRHIPGWAYALLAGAVVLVVFAAIVLPIMSGSKAKQAAAGGASSAPVGAMVQVFAWPGGGASNDIRNSAPFTLQGGHQRVTVLSQPITTPYAMPAQGWTIEAADGGSQMEMINPASFGASQSDLYLPAGSYYLSSNTIDCTWTLTVLEER